MRTTSARPRPQRARRRPPGGRQTAADVCACLGFEESDRNGVSGGWPRPRGCQRLQIHELRLDPSEPVSLRAASVDSLLRRHNQEPRAGRSQSAESASSRLAPWLAWTVDDRFRVVLPAAARVRALGRAHPESPATNDGRSSAARLVRSSASRADRPIQEIGITHRGARLFCELDQTALQVPSAGPSPSRSAPSPPPWSQRTFVNRRSIEAAGSPG